MSSDTAYIEVKTIENTRVRIQKSNIGAIEEIPTTARSEGYIKIYVEGFAFNVRMTFEEVMKVIHGK